MKSICKIDKCNNLIHGKDLCQKHYIRWRTHGDPLYIRKKNICKVDNCTRIMYCKDYCSRHYQKFRAHGDPLFTHEPLHGQSRMPIYNTWNMMKQRCLNPSYTHYNNYGGRGITVCKRWLDFKNFYSDMGDRPEGMELDRIDTNGNYEPGNCRWVTRTENNRNQRRNKLIPEQIKRIRSLYPIFSQREIAKQYNISKTMVGSIVNNKSWSHI